MKIPTALRTTLVLAGITLIAACATQHTTVRDYWAAPGVTKLAFQRVVVVGLAPNNAARQRFEDALVARLKVTATPSSRVLNDADLNNAGSAGDKLRALGYDGAVVVRLVSAESVANTMPVPGPMTDWSLGGSNVSKSTVMITTTYALEVTVYDVKSGQPQASIRTETFQPSDPALLADRVFDAVVAEFKARGIL